MVRAAEMETAHEAASYRNFPVMVFLFQKPVVRTHMVIYCLTLALISQHTQMVTTY